MDAVEVRLLSRADKLSRELRLLGPRWNHDASDKKRHAKLVAQLHAVSTALFLRRQMKLDFHKE